MTIGAPPELIQIVDQKKSNKKAEISVIITLYNYQDYIEETLESVYSQNIELLDIVVVNDCSKDNSLEVAAQWFAKKGQRFNQYKMLHHKINQGLGKARNTAFAQAETEFVFVLDADNLLYPRCLQQHLLGLKNTDASFAFCYLEHFDGAQQLGGIDLWNPLSLRNGNTIDAMVLHRKKIWEQVNGYSEDMPANGWEDFEMWFKIASIEGWGVRIPEILARYRVHYDSMLHQETNVKHVVLWEYIKNKHPRFF